MKQSSYNTYQFTYWFLLHLGAFCWHGCSLQACWLFLCLNIFHIGSHTGGSRSSVLLSLITCSGSLSILSNWLTVFICCSLILITINFASINGSFIGGFSDLLCGGGSRDSRSLHLLTRLIIYCGRSHSLFLCNLLCSILSRCGGLFVSSLSRGRV